MLGGTHQTRSDSDVSKSPSPYNNVRIEALLQQIICGLTDKSTTIHLRTHLQEVITLGGQNNESCKDTPSEKIINFLFLSVTMKVTL